MNRIFAEENGIYQLDCSKAVWATDDVHLRYQQAGIHIKDADFIIETETALVIVEYKNANISGAANPSAFNPMAGSKISDVTRKYYDTLHYLTLRQKTGPKHYVYIVEAQNSDSVMRKRLRDQLTRELPFKLQEDMKAGIHLIESVDVLSIAEWNAHDEYKKFPLVRI